MMCAWNDYLAILPPERRAMVDKYRDTLQELRLREGKPPEAVTSSGSVWLCGAVSDQELRFVFNTSCRYSPWAAETVSRGFITAPGGHRIGLCGEVITQNRTITGIRNITSLNIRVARDFPGIADELDIASNCLILGPPCSGKTTLVRDLIRKISRTDHVTVIDERQEIFPVGLDRGVRTDVLEGCSKADGIGMALRTMSPDWIAVDEVTSEEDCLALRSALWCGVRLIATAHASCRDDFLTRPVYRPLAQSRCFDTVIVMGRDKSWHRERMKV